jgi:hypothetical protein
MRLLGPLVTDSEQRKNVFAEAATVPGSSSGLEIPPEFNSHQYLIFLLHIAAEVEHALMVQYLYAGFSLGGSAVPEKHHAAVIGWQETVLGIAKEEMGHLLTVQNLLRCLGGPLNLDREDYPWDSSFFPFPFRLEPLSLNSLAKYVYAESPESWKGPEADEIRKIAESQAVGKALHRIGDLYAAIKMILDDTRAIKDNDFRAWTHPFQANWDEWGRGYKEGARGNTSDGKAKKTPNVLIFPIVSRSSAIDAIRGITQQGEANAPPDDTAPSHFARFLAIYRAYPREGWVPTRNIPIDPVVVVESLGVGVGSCTAITHDETRLWAYLFNVRYRLLLIALLHSFDYPSNLWEASQWTPRGLLIHLAFGEMYNLRALSHVLTQMPLTPDEDGRMAGPPFQMPYTVRLPFDQIDRWRSVVDLLDASATLLQQLRRIGTIREAFVTALEGADSELRARTEAILASHHATTRMPAPARP